MQCSHFPAHYNIGSHLPFYCRLHLRNWKPCLVTTHVCRRYAGVWLLSSCCSRCPVVEDLRLCRRCRQLDGDCHWITTKRKLYGARQVDANTRFRVQLCQLTALRLSPWYPLAIWASTYTPRLKNKQNYFCYKYVRLPPNLTIFGIKMANSLSPAVKSKNIWLCGEILKLGTHRGPL